MRGTEADAGDNRAFRGEPAAAYERVGDIQGNPTMPNLGRSMDAIASIGTLDRAETLLAAARSRAPDDHSMFRESAAQRDRLSDALAMIGKPEDALIAGREGQRFMEQIVTDDATPTDLSNLAVSHGTTAYLLLSLSRAEEASVASTNAVGFVRRALSIAPTNALALRLLSVSLNHFAAIEMQRGRFDSARSTLEESLAIAERLAAADPSDTVAAGDVSYTLNKLGELSIKIADSAVAEAELASTPVATRRELLRKAAECYEEAGAVLEAMRTDGVLATGDAELPAQLFAKAAASGAALEAHEAPPPDRDPATDPH
mgnify:CR=1 FL=1